MKRFPVVFLAVLFALSLMSVNVFAAGSEPAGDGETAYDLWIGSTQVTDGNKDNVLEEDKASVSFDPQTCTLTLDNASLDDFASHGRTGEKSYPTGIYAKGMKLTIHLIGESTLAYDGTEESYGITVEDTVTADEDTSGDSGLTITGTEEGKLSITHVYQGIRTERDLVLKSGTCEVKDSIAPADHPDYVTYGIGSFCGDIRIEGGSLLIDTNGTGVAADSNLYVTGGNVDVKAEWTGIRGDFGVTISGGTLKVASELEAIKTLDGDILISGGEVTAVSSDSDAIYAERDEDSGDNKGNITISGGTLTAESTDSLNSRGYLSAIHAMGTVHITNSAERAKARTTGKTAIFGEKAIVIDGSIEEPVGGEIQAYTLDMSERYEDIRNGFTVGTAGSAGFSPAAHVIAGPLKTSIEGAKVVLSKASLTYSGKAILPQIRTIGGETLTADTDYTAEWSDPEAKAVGTYTVTITGKGNHYGKTTATYKIVPKGTSLKKVKKAKKAATVKWKKQAAKMPKARVSGYQIQLATNSKFTKNKKTVTVKGFKKTSKKNKETEGRQEVLRQDPDLDEDRWQDLLFPLVQGQKGEGQEIELKEGNKLQWRSQKIPN